MIPTASVVTPERFETGLASFEAWLAAIPKNQEKFQAQYDACTPDAAALAALKTLVDLYGIHALALGEHWCPDVQRGFGVLAKLAELTSMPVRYFFRDQNKDIMAEFLKDGVKEAIPTFVFYDRDHRYLTHWIERPVIADAALAAPRAILKAHPEDGPERKAAFAEMGEIMTAAAPAWRAATLSEIVALLSAARSDTRP